MTPPMADPFPGESDDALRAFIGPNAGYYLTERRVMAESGSRVSWNWPAFLFTFLWMAYRKMWALAALACVLAVVFSASLFFSWLGLVLMLGLGIYGNALYLGHARRKVTEVALAVPDASARLARLADTGGTSWPAAVVAFVAAVGLTTLSVMIWGSVLTALLGGLVFWQFLQPVAH